MKKRITIDPVVIEFDKPEEKWTDLTWVVVSLSKAHTQLILAFPDWALAPELSDIIKSNKWFSLSPAFEYNIERTKKMIEEWVNWCSLSSNTEAQTEWYRVLFFIYQQQLLANFGFLDNFYSQLMSPLNREERRKKEWLLKKLASFLKPQKASINLLDMYEKNLWLHYYIQKHWMPPVE